MSEKVVLRHSSLEKNEASIFHALRRTDDLLEEEFGRPEIREVELHVRIEENTEIKGFTLGESFRNHLCRDHRFFPQSDVLEVPMVGTLLKYILVEEEWFYVKVVFEFCRHSLRAGADHVEP